MPDPHVARESAAAAPIAGLEARRMARAARLAVSRLRALRARRAQGQLSDADYRRLVAAELTEDQPPSPGDAA